MFIHQREFSPQSIRRMIIAVICTAFIWQCIGAAQDSQTTDEAVHLTAGRAYWQTGAWFLNPEHPALFKLWAALPLRLLPDATIPTNSPEWLSGNQWTIASSFLYESPAAKTYGSQLLLLYGRIPMILVWLGLIITLAKFTWHRWGPWSSLAATTALAYDPTFLAHGHIVTNDVATAFVYLAVWLIARRQVLRPSWKHAWQLGAVVAVAVLTKFSVFMIVWALPLVLAITTLYNTTFSWRWWWRTLTCCLLASALLIPAIYGFSAPRPIHDSRVPQLWHERSDIVQRHLEPSLPRYTRLFVTLTNPSSISGKIAGQLQYLPMPGYWYWRGFFSAASHNAYGHSGFLLGHTSDQGWWYYFPVALAVKTPILTLLLLLVWCTWSLRSKVLRKSIALKDRWPIDFWFLCFPPIVFLAWSMTSHINIGVRHILPTMVFFPLAIAAGISRVQRHWPKLPIQSVVLTISIITITVTTAAWPNTFGYFNALVGGTSEGHRILRDSNLDWNQDLIRFQNFLKHHSFPEVHGAFFGSVPIQTVFPELLGVWRDDAIAQGEHPTGIVAISAGIQYDDSLPFSWLQQYSPTWRIGSSIQVYDFR